jgi:hypothetical protein
VQLQQALPQFEAAGIRVFAVSYDPVEALAAFAGEFGITYPLLSDGGSEVIRHYGIFNTTVEPDHRAYGVPFPGSYVTDSSGRVVEKLFFETHRIRQAAPSVLKDAFGVDFDVTANPHAEVEAEGIHVSATLAADSLIFMQRVPLYVRLDLDPGLHVYAPPMPEGFIPTQIELDLPEGVEAGELRYPESHPFHVEGIDADFQAMDGRVEIAIPLMSTVEEGELLPIDVTVRYQACTERECYLPQEQRLHLDVPVGRLLRPPRRE